VASIGSIAAGTADLSTDVRAMPTSVPRTDQAGHAYRRVNPA
jgi:hypothetical protein